MGCWRDDPAAPCEGGFAVKVCTFGGWLLSMLGSHGRAAASCALGQRRLPGDPSPKLSGTSIPEQAVHCYAAGCHSHPSSCSGQMGWNLLRFLRRAPLPSTGGLLPSRAACERFGRGAEHGSVSCQGGGYQASRVLGGHRPAKNLKNPTGTVPTWL